MGKKDDQIIQRGVINLCQERGPTMVRHLCTLFFASCFVMLSSGVLFAVTDSDSIPIDADYCSGTLSVSVTRTAGNVYSNHSIYVSAGECDISVSWDAYLKSSISSSGTLFNDWNAWDVSEGNSKSDSFYSGLKTWSEHPYARTHAELNPDDPMYDDWDDWVNAEL